MSNTTINSGGYSICLNDNVMIINDEIIKTPKKFTNNIPSITVINNNLYIGGYKYIQKEKRFKRTLISLFHYYF